MSKFCPIRGTNYYLCRTRLAAGQKIKIQRGWLVYVDTGEEGGMDYTGGRAKPTECDDHR